MMFNNFLENYGDPNVFGVDLRELDVDEAFLHIVSNVGRNLNLYQKSSFCNGCPYRKVEEINGGQNLTMKYDTKSYWNFYLSSSAEDEYIHAPGLNSSFCMVEDVSMGEFGIYQMNINESSCDIEILKSPVFIYTGLILGILFYILLSILCLMVNSIVKCCKKKSEKLKIVHISDFDPSCNEKPNIEPKTKVKKESRVRLKSLDTFRGLTIIAMVLVNHGGGKYWIFMHAPWNGLTIADIVFPWFLWIMGVCIPMGLNSQKKKSIPKCKIFIKIIERSVKLFVIGIILNSVGGHNQLESFRIPGVLQRFAIAYLFTSFLMLFLGPNPGREQKTGCCGVLDDIIVLIPQWFIYILLMVGHTMFIFNLPIPGCPTGYIGPGGMSLFQDDNPSPDCVGGVTRFVDLWVLGNNHILQHPTPNSIYNTSSLDPEGILGCVTTLFQVFLGIQAGQILLSFKDHGKRIKRWFIWGFLTLAGGLALSSGTMLEGPIPVNKNLWSLSYVLVTSGLAFIMLAICYFLIDVKKWLSGTPFYQTGMNSIFIYVAHFLTYNVFPWRYRVGEMKTHLSLFIEALWGTTLWVLIALYLHRKRKFYTI